MDIPFRVLTEGLFCHEGNFFIDAWKPVPVCVVTHAHGDHAYYGHGLYIASSETVEIIKHRFGKDTPCQALEYNTKIKLGNCWISLHPAGHILGSSQIRIETTKNVSVISGDYKRAYDATCKPFEVVECDIFVTESTFALPIYQWQQSDIIASEIYTWWQQNAKENHPSLLFCYALGKAERVMNLLTSYTEETIYLHGAIHSLATLYQQMGVSLPNYKSISETDKNKNYKSDLIIAPPSAIGSPWMKRFSNCKVAFASGWMSVRGTRRRKALDRGFVLSDHADWPALLKTIDDSKAKVILTTHGNASSLARYLKEIKGLDAYELKGLEDYPQEDE